MIALVDVNVLVALAWPNHVHHAAAHTWFGTWTSGWATTPVTESGFVRVSSSAAATGSAVRPVDAIALLQRIRDLSCHEFWPDSIEAVVGDHLPATRVLGHRQVTDAHLLALAMANDGTLATFDQGLRSLADRALTRHVTVLPTRPDRDER